MEFIRRHQLGWIALAHDEQRTLLTRLSNDNNELQAMAKSVDTYRRWNANANEQIVPLLESLVRL